MSNIAGQVALSLGRAVDRIISAFGRWGSAKPADDSKSGIMMGDKVYQVVVSLNGCYYYIDEDGKKQAIADIPKTEEWEWVNIAEKFLQHFKTCYRTLGGKVEVSSWYMLNDELEILKETHTVTDSTDVDNPTGTRLEEIPAGWTMIDCDLPDMTERDVTPVNECYRTPGGKVNIEGLESIDDVLTNRVSIYSVLQSTDPDIAVGAVYNVIPNTWDRMVCDFPDMTQRQINPVDECYKTAGGKIHLGGYRIVDFEGTNRKEYYYVSESTDPDIPIHTVFTSIDEDWEQMVCDFPDKTTADTETVENCYTTAGGKVQIRNYITFDSEANTRTINSIVLRSTDPAYTVGQQIEGIPAGWLSAECDFASLTERHIVVQEKCFETDGGKIKTDVLSVMNNNMEADSVIVVVKESTDPNIFVEQQFDEIQFEWNPIACDMASLTERHMVPAKECYESADGRVYVEGYRLVSNGGDIERAELTILESTVADVTVGTVWTSIPEGYTRTNCLCNCCV